MANQKNLSIKRFGARYGRNVKHRFAAVEAQHRKSYQCPYCHAVRVRRTAVGIWQCSKCSSKFTARAYTVPRKKSAEMAEMTAPALDQAAETMPSGESILSQGEEEEVAVSRQPDVVGVVGEKKKPVETQPLDVPVDLEEQ